MRCIIIFFTLIMSFGISLSAACLGDACQSQCAAYCFSCTSSLTILQKRTEACEAAVSIARMAFTDKRLDTIGAPLTMQQNRENNSRLLLPAAEHLTKKAETFIQLGSKYYHIEKELSLNWHEALDKCHRMGAHLASPQNQEELDAFNQRLTPSYRYWIDVTNQFKENEYVSVTKGTKANFLRWSDGEPNKDGECVDIQINYGRTTMNDNKCFVKLFFICEKAADF